jgi:hypothetical protein
MRIVRLLITGSACLFASALHAQQSDAEPIKDNSFLIEEAYNQDAGVVQHINTFARPTAGDAWAYTFTQEWPVRSMRHQLSYFVPVAGLGSRLAGFGDVAVNYRYQLLGMSGGAGEREGGGAVAVSPRVSLTIPTGDYRTGTGLGSASVQLMLPASFELPHLALHLNAGLTAAPRARDATGDVASATSFVAGSSVVWLATTRFNALVEMVWNRTASVVGPNATVSTNQTTIAPGVRWAHNLAHGVQVVPGIAYVLGVSPERNRSLFLYVSVEHPFTHQTPGAR